MSFFRNLWVYDLAAPFTRSPEELEAALDAHRLRECGPLEREVHGFSSPFGAESDVLVHAAAGRQLLNLTIADRLLPASVIKDAVQERLRASDAVDATAARRRELKDQVIVELLPQAFVRKRHVKAYIDPARSLLVIDTASEKVAEQVQTALRDALDSFPVAQPEHADVSRRMSLWLESGQLPSNLELGDECELRDPRDQSCVVRCRGQELTSPEVRAHLKAGLAVTQLKLQWSDRLQFVLTASLEVRRLAAMDLLIDQFPEASDDLRAEMDAMFVLMAGEIDHLWTDLSRGFA